MYSKFAVELLVLLTVATSVLSASVPKKSEESSGITVLQKVYDDCQDKSDFTGCLKGKALTALTRAVDQVMNCGFNQSVLLKFTIKLN